MDFSRGAKNRPRLRPLKTFKSGLAHSVLKIFFDDSGVEQLGDVGGLDVEVEVRNLDEVGLKCFFPSRLKISRSQQPLQFNFAAYLKIRAAVVIKKR